MLFRSPIKGLKDPGIFINNSKCYFHWIFTICHSLSTNLLFFISVFSIGFNKFDDFLLIFRCEFEVILFKKGLGNNLLWFLYQTYTTLEPLDPLLAKLGAGT